MCSLLSGRDQVPLAMNSFKWEPHPSFNASVKICRACCMGCNGWPVRTLSSLSHHCKWGCRDLGRGITFSNDSGILQLLLRCHWMGLICNLPRWTCFSVAFKRPIKDMNSRTEQVGRERSSRKFTCRLCHRSCVGRTWPDSRSNW